MESITMTTHLSSSPSCLFAYSYLFLCLFPSFPELFSYLLPPLSYFFPSLSSLLLPSSTFQLLLCALEHHLKKVVSRLQELFRTLSCCTLFPGRVSHRDDAVFSGCGHCGLALDWTFIPGLDVLRRIVRMN